MTRANLVKQLLYRNRWRNTWKISNLTSRCGGWIDRGTEMIVREQ